VNTILKFAVLVLLSLAPSMPLPPVCAQQPPADLSIRVNAVDVSAFPQVALTVTARDANGVPVPGLDARAFEVNEDRAPQARPITAVEPVTNPDLPVCVALVVDVSGSMAGQPLADAQNAARALVEQLGAEDEVAFIAFAGAVDLDGLDPAREHPPTTDRRVVMALIDDLAAGGGTSLYDALYKGVLWAEEATLGHRAVILLTDGVDEAPGSAVASDETPIQEATRANVPVFTIGLGGQIDAGYLERVARTTGGVYQETPDSAGLTTLFLNVLERLKQQYVITYESALPSDGEMHRVTVAVEVEDRRASDEAELGPLPLAVALTEEPTPTTEPIVAPAVTVAVTEPAAVQESTPGGFGWPAAATAVGGLGLLVVVALGVVIAARRRRAAQQEYCKGCGRTLAPGEVCPDCGPDAGRFRKPRR
jgi:VWFA-related protein